MAESSRKNMSVDSLEISRISLILVFRSRDGPTALSLNQNIFSNVLPFFVDTLQRAEHSG